MLDTTIQIGSMTTINPRDVQTTLNYCQQQYESPCCSYIDREPPVGVPVHNITYDPRSVLIHDARGKEHTAFGLDTSGFQWLKYPSVETQFVDEERIKTAYYPEVEDILKKYAGAKRVLIFDHTIRRNSKAQTGPVRMDPRGPAHFVHGDHTFTGAEQMVRRRLLDDADRLLKGRYRLVNVWRPIAHNVAHYPLAAIDFRSLDIDADLVSHRLIFQHHESAAYDVKYNPRHQWYYISDQTPDEVMLIKCFDSDSDKARLAPHSAFPDRTSPADAPYRQSIEVRAMVFDSD